MSQTVERPTMTVKEVAELMQVSEMTIRRAISMGQIPAFRISGMIRISRAAIERMIEANTPLTK